MWYWLLRVLPCWHCWHEHGQIEVVVYLSRRCQAPEHRLRDCLKCCRCGDKKAVKPPVPVFWI